MKVLACLALCLAVTFAEPPANRQRYFFARQQVEPSSGPYAPSGWRPEGPAFNLPQRSQKQQQAPENQYGPPQQPQQPQQQYGPPQQPQQPQQQYGPPQQPQQPQQQYGPPQQPQQPEQQYGPAEVEPLPSPRKQQTPQVVKTQQFARQQQFVGQQQRFNGQQQQQFNAFAKQQQEYGAPKPPQTYGAPQQQYGAPDYPTTTDLPNVTEVDEPITASPDTEAEYAVNELQNEEADIDEPSSRQQQQPQERGEYYVAHPDGRLQRVRYVSRQDLEAMRYFAKIRAENVEPLRGPIYAYSPLQKLEVAPGSLQVAPAAPSLTVTAVEAKTQKLVAPKLEVKPLAQIQVQHDAVAPVVPLSGGYATYTANYQVPAAAPVEERYILAFP